MKHTSTLTSGACIAALALCTPLGAFAQATKTSPAAGSSPVASPPSRSAPVNPAAQVGLSPEPKISPSPAASPAASPAKAPRAVPYRGTISAVDQTAMTFTIEGKDKFRVFKITARTEITKDGKAATIVDVVEKEAVRGSYWKQDDGTLEAKSVKLGVKPATEKTTKKAKSESEETSSSAESSPASSPKASPKSSPKASPATKASPSSSPRK